MLCFWRTRIDGILNLSWGAKLFDFSRLNKTLCSVVGQKISITRTCISYILIGDFKPAVCSCFRSVNKFTQLIMLMKLAQWICECQIQGTHFTELAGFRSWVSRSRDSRYCFRSVTRTRTHRCCVSAKRCVLTASVTPDTLRPPNRGHVRVNPKSNIGG